MDLADLLGKLNAEVDFLREGVRVLAEALMDEEVSAQIGAEWGERVPDRRTAQRNGYREPRRWDTRVGSIDLRIPKLRTGSYFPSFLDARRRSEQALCAVVAQAYVEGVSTRRVDDVARAMGIDGISKSEVSRICKRLGEVVEKWRNRPLGASPYTFVWIDALVIKVREGGRIANTSVLVATAVNVEGQREILGVDIGSAEDGATWTAFLRGLVARGLSGVKLVISDAHGGLCNAIAAVLDGASWQRCRAHFMRNLQALYPPSRPTHGGLAGAHDLCSGALTRRVGATGPGRDAVARDHVRRRGGPARRGRPGGVGVYGFPARGVAQDLVEQPPRAAEQGNPPPHRRGRDLSQP